MPDRPQVTITDPARPDRPADVLDGGDPAPGSPRRLVVVAVAVLAALAAVSGVDELRERRAADAEERRLQAVLDIELVDRNPSFQSADYAGAEQEAVLRRFVAVRNRGPRTVVVQSATVDGLRLVGGAVELEPDGERRMLLEQRVPCTPAPSDVSPSPVVALGVSTLAGPQQVELRLRPDEVAFTAEPGRACGYLRGYDAVSFSTTDGARLTGRSLDLPLAVSSGSVLPVSLVDVQPGRGLVGELLDPGGAPVPLPLPLEPRDPDGTAVERSLLLRLRVADCSLVDAADVQSFEPSSAFALSWTAGDDIDPEGVGAATTLLGDPGPVDDLLAASCP